MPRNEVQKPLHNCVFSWHSGECQVKLPGMHGNNRGRSPVPWRWLPSRWLLRNTSTIVLYFPRPVSMPHSLLSFTSPISKRAVPPAVRLVSLLGPTANALTPPHSSCHCCLLANQDKYCCIVAAACRRLLFDPGLERQRLAATTYTYWANIGCCISVKKISPNTQSTPIPASIGQYLVCQY